MSKGRLVPRVYNITAGPGGRSSNSGITATVFGATGFVGRYLVNELGRIGSRVYVPFRGCELEVRHLKPMCDLGQLGLMPFSPRDEQSIRDAIKHSDVVINMIGKHYETKHLVPTRRENGKISNINYGFEEANAGIAKTLARLSKEAGVRTFIHVGALAANPTSKSRWSQSKAAGEVAVRETFPEAIIVKPATVFGHEDRFLNWIAEGLERLPAFPLLNNGSALTQPVYSQDVSAAIMAMIKNHKAFAGKTFQLVGPAEYSYKEVVEFVSDLTTIKKPLIDTPLGAAKFAASFLENTINPFLTQDGLAQIQEDCVASKDPTLLSFETLDMTPQSMDKIAFDYLHRYRPGGHFKLVSGYYNGN